MKMISKIKLHSNTHDEKNLAFLTELEKSFPYSCDNSVNLYNEKDNMVYIGQKQRKNRAQEPRLYFYNDKDFSELNKKLNAISYHEEEMAKHNIDLSGIKSYNRNIWLDLARESNAIEGIFDDFPYDLLDLRVELRGKIAHDPKTKKFDKYEYYKNLKAQYESICENNDSRVIRGKMNEHTLSLEMIRHFMAFKYAYKCAKQDKLIKAKRNLKSSENKEILTEEELLEEKKSNFFNLILRIHSLIAGSETLRFRNTPIYVKGTEYGDQPKWVPPGEDEVVDYLDSLVEWVVDDRKSGNIHPIIKSAIFHAEFIRIHPFMDGNGRTGRILSNYLLIRDEMPTVALRSRNTRKYFDAIDKAIEKHEVDDLIDLFKESVETSSKYIERCLEYIEAKQKGNLNEAKENSYHTTINKQ